MRPPTDTQLRALHDEFSQLLYRAEAIADTLDPGRAAIRTGRSGLRGIRLDLVKKADAIATLANAGLGLAEAELVHRAEV